MPLVALTATSCVVSTRRFDSLRAELIAAESRLEQQRALADEVMAESDQLEHRNTQLNAEIATLTDKQAALQDKYERLLDNNKANTSDLTRQMAAASNNAARADALEQQVRDNAARVAELERLLKARDEAINGIRKKVADALTGFDGKGLSITERDGMVYVSMDDKLLFRSGSFEIGERGQAAIKDLAAVLAHNTDISVMVEGHTDDVPYSGRGLLVDNLDLSAKRATSVVRLLLKGGDIDPTRVIASGRGEWLPVTMGTSADARSRNRRTEIILTPKLDELRQLLK